MKGSQLETEAEDTSNQDDVTIDDQENLEAEDGAESSEDATDETKVEDSEDQDDKTKSEDETFSIDLTQASPAEADDPEESSTVKKMRAELRASNKRERELKKQVKAQEKKAIASQLPKLGPEPKLEDFDYDEGDFKKAFLEYGEVKRAHDAKAEQLKKKAQSQNEAYQKRLSSYIDAKQSLAVDDMDDAEDAVRAAIDPTRQGVLITAAQKPAVFILALGRNPKALERLKAIDDPIVFAAEVARMEGKLNVTSKPKTVPERRVETSGGGALTGSSAKQLEQLEKEADRTGDRTKVARFKRQMKAQAQS